MSFDMERGGAAWWVPMIFKLSVILEEIKMCVGSDTIPMMIILTSSMGGKCVKLLARTLIVTRL
jgi:hypothetical protein